MIFAMNNKLLLILIFCVIGQAGIFGQNEKFVVEGAIVVGNTNNLPPVPGTIRFNPNNNDFEGWNGYFWTSLTGIEFGSVTDIDGNVYKTLDIGNKTWMMENLKVTRFRNGVAIEEITNDNDWGNAFEAARCSYGNSAANNAIYGQLYNFYAIEDLQGLCPEGWEVPSDAQWADLVSTFGGEAIAGGKLKQVGTTLWTAPNVGATNESGFTGLPGGSRGFSGFAGINDGGRWWTRSKELNAFGRSWGMWHSNTVAQRSANDFYAGFSVRCVK